MRNLPHQIIIKHIILCVISCYSACVLSYQQTKIDSVLQALLDYLTSKPARIIAVLAIVGVGYSTLQLGRMQRSRAIAVVLGIGIIFGAATILKMLGLEEN